MIYLVIVFFINTPYKGRVEIHRADVPMQICEAIADSIRVEKAVHSVGCYKVEKK